MPRHSAKSGQPHPGKDVKPRFLIGAAILNLHDSLANSPYWTYRNNKTLSTQD
jgi:hypothetical protein